MGSGQGCGSWWFTPGVNSFLPNWLFVVWFLLCAVRLPLPGLGQAEIPPGASRGLPALHLLPGRSQPPGKGPAGSTHTAIWPLPLLWLRPWLRTRGKCSERETCRGVTLPPLPPRRGTAGCCPPQSPDFPFHGRTGTAFISPLRPLPPPPLSPLCSSSTCARTFASRRRPRTRGAWGRTSGTSSWTGTR